MPGGPGPESAETTSHADRCVPPSTTAMCTMRKAGGQVLTRLPVTPQPIPWKTCRPSPREPHRLRLLGRRRNCPAHVKTCATRGAPVSSSPTCFAVPARGNLTRRPRARGTLTRFCGPNLHRLFPMLTGWTGQCCGGGCGGGCSRRIRAVWSRFDGSRSRRRRRQKGSRCPFMGLERRGSRDWEPSDFQSSSTLRLSRRSPYR